MVDVRLRAMLVVPQRFNENGGRRGSCPLFGSQPPSHRHCLTMSLERATPAHDRLPFQSLVRNSLPVHACHIVAGMAPDVIDGRLVFRFVGHSSKCMPKGIKTSASVDVEL